MSYEILYKILMYGVPAIFLFDTAAVATIALNHNILLLSHKLYKERLENNGIKYKSETEDYNKKMKEYCDKIKKMDLSDLELFIKLIQDLWKNIDGYSIGKDDFLGYERVYLDMSKKGCCRHFADDFTAKLNYINPKYNARNVMVNLEKSREVFNIPTEFKLVPNDSNKSTNKVDDNDEEDFQNIDNEIKEKIEKEIKNKNNYGNHVVCAVDIPHENITLMIDPTNSIIGYFKGKKIITYGNDKPVFTYTKKDNIIYSKSFAELLKNRIKMSLNKFKSSDEIDELFGINAQLKAYEKVLYIDQDEKLGYQKSF